MLLKQVIKVLEDLARAYRKNHGLDGAYDPELRAAENIIEKYYANKKE
jgi:hypothetical protein